MLCVQRGNRNEEKDIDQMGGEEDDSEAVGGGGEVFPAGIFLKPVILWLKEGEDTSCLSVNTMLDNKPRLSF